MAGNVHRPLRKRRENALGMWNIYMFRGQWVRSEATMPNMWATCLLIVCTSYKVIQSSYKHQSAPQDVTHYHTVPYISRYIIICSILSFYFQILQSQHKPVEIPKYWIPHVFFILYPWKSKTSKTMKIIVPNFGWLSSLLKKWMIKFPN